MNDWDIEDEWDWDLSEEDEEDLHYDWAEALADIFFLSENSYLPTVIEDYSLGFLEPEDWLPLVQQIEHNVDLDVILALAEKLQPLVQLPGLPTELLEAPLAWLESALEGNLPAEANGRRVGSRRLVQIALVVTRLAMELPDTARAAIRMWAEVQRSVLARLPFDADEDEDGDDVELPPAVTGFSMMIALTLIRWPQRAEGVPLPPGFVQPELYAEILQRWETLPDGIVEDMEEAGEAEIFFAHGQLAHLLAQMDAPSDVGLNGQDPEAARAYSRLSRAILWVHNQCRHCTQRQEMTCRAATNGPERPVPLLDVAGEVANTGKIEGCILMEPDD